MARTGDTCDLQVDIDAVETKIKAVEIKEERLEGALEGSGSYLGSTDHDVLRAFHASLMKEKEQLRKKEEQLRETQLILLRLQQATPPSSEGLGPSDGGQKRRRTGVGAAVEGDAGAPALPAGRARDVIDVSDDSGGSSVSASASASSSTGVQGGAASSRSEGEATRLHVKTLTGSTFTHRVPCNSTVLDLKMEILHQAGFPVDQQRLMFAGEQLEDERALDDYHKITDGSTIHLVLKLSGGKPVILLYPPAPLDATVELQLNPLWSFSALYPRPPPNKLHQGDTAEAVIADGQQCNWSVHASPDGSLRDLSTGREYPYLFWEADSADGRVSRVFGLDRTKSFCVAGGAAGVFLDGALERLGLNVRERCDMITYCLPQLESSPFNVIYFVQTALYEKAARLTIVPAPDVTIRVFMTFRGVDAYDAELDTAKVEELRAPARKGFVAVEWGGMNLNGGAHE